MTTRRIAVVTAGLGQPSSTRLLADRLAAATADALAERGVEAEVDVVEVREHAHAVTDALLTGFAGRDLQAALDAVASADGVIAVTPVYSGSYTGLFKSFVDLLEPGALAGTPLLLAATAGTARHSLALEHALRPLFSYLRALTVPTGVFAAAEDWGGDGDAAGALGERVGRAAAELADLVAARRPKQATDAFAAAAATGFEALLGGAAPR